MSKFFGAFLCSNIFIFQLTTNLFLTCIHCIPDTCLVLLFALFFPRCWKGGILEAQCTYTVMCKSKILTSKTEDKYRLAGKGLKEWGKWVFEEESPSQHILRFSRKSFSAITTWLLQNVGLLETSWSSSRILRSNAPFKVWQIKC